MNHQALHPTHIGFAVGSNEVAAKAGHKMNSGVLTSKQRNLPGVAQGQPPSGVTKWPPSFYLEDGQFVITTAPPGAEVSEYAHDADSVRFIMSGSVLFDGIELHAGDWMLIPKDQIYSLKVGPQGALTCYCYSPAAAAAAAAALAAN